MLTSASGICAVRASRFSPSFDPLRFTSAEEKDPRVRAEIVTLQLPGAQSPDAIPQGATC